MKQDATMNFQKFVSKSAKAKKVLIAFVGIFFVIGLFFYSLKTVLVTNYEKFQSVIITDRNGEIISIKPNAKGNYARYADSLPARFRDLLVRKEDRFFYFHLGFNPISTLRALYVYLKTGAPGASSTITQQLAKNLLGNENRRNLENKIGELLHSLALELFLGKETILTMYGNTVYMGNGIQGFEGATESYFGKNLADLNDTEILSLIATISNPSSLNPWKSDNVKSFQKVALRLGVPADPKSLVIKKAFRAVSDSDFELESLGGCRKSCSVTLDKNLTDRLRLSLRRNISETSLFGGRNGAIVAIKLPENELLAVIGTPDTGGGLSGTAINMATEPRPIGSTIKPFIYLKAFEKGLRPYTLVNDREYKFPIATGFPLYPKNYDGAYRGIVTLHEALSNSLNVPTVKTLEYVTLPDFYSFLEHTLGFKPLQPMDSYAYGIALGGLEMEPLTLAHYFTIFGNHGELKPLKLYADKAVDTLVPAMETNTLSKHIADERYIELVNKIISDRLAGVEQFGLAGNLNLSQSNYAVKTGTSRDFHDTWTVGFTPDFLVTVWLGNVENEPMRQITSTSGAGKIWHDAMELLINSPYNKKTPFDFSGIMAYEINQKVEYGLAGDNVKVAQNLLSEKSLILNPHDGDTFKFEADTEISLKAAAPARWYANNQFLGEDVEISFRPPAAGTYTIRAVSASKKEETMKIRVVEN